MIARYPAFYLTQCCFYVGAIANKIRIDPNVPANEYTMMRLAAAAGIQTPEVKLVTLEDVYLGGLAGLWIPQWETWAYAIKRYDRTAEGRVHVEDFAQVFNVHADQEYKATNYDTIGRLIFDLLPNRFEQIAEFVRRLVVNILIGNGDAHLTNWSVIYRDKVTPQLAPAYDLVSTIQYVRNASLALNLGGEKRFDSINEAHSTGPPAAWKHHRNSCWTSSRKQ